MKDIAILDSGATNHYLKRNTNAKSTELATLGPIVHLPDGDTMQATHTTSLQMPKLSQQGKQAYSWEKYWAGSNTFAVAAVLKE